MIFVFCIIVNYCNQWVDYEGGYEIYFVVYEQLLEDLNSGFGIVVFGDDVGNGIYNIICFYGVYSYCIKINWMFVVCIGVEVGMIQFSFDWDQLVFLDQLDFIIGVFGGGGVVIFIEEQ